MSACFSNGQVSLWHPTANMLTSLSAFCPQSCEGRKHDDFAIPVHKTLGVFCLHVLSTAEIAGYMQATKMMFRLPTRRLLRNLGTLKCSFTMLAPEASNGLHQASWKFQPTSLPRASMQESLAHCCGFSRFTGQKVYNCTARARRQAKSVLVLYSSLDILPQL